MPTGLSLTSSRTSSRTGPAHLRRAKRSVADVAHLVRFRTAAVRRKSALRWALAIMGGLTVAACTVPMALPGAHEAGRARDVLLLLPTAFVGFLLLTIVSAVASGGGRELLSREQGVAFPVSPTTDHLGALLLAPLNIAWLLQAWVLLGSAAYALSADRLPAAIVVILLWLVFSTTVAQVVAWSMEAIRRRTHGIGIVRRSSSASASSRCCCSCPAGSTYYLDHLPTVGLVARSPGFRVPLAGGVSFQLASSWWPLVAGAVAAHARPVGRRATRLAWRVAASPRAGCPRPPSA